MQFPNNKIKKVVDEDHAFHSFFNSETGEYVRTGLLDINGMDTGEDPFMASFPHLLDIGIMGHCSHGLSGLCSAAGNYCYQSGALIQKPNMPLSDFKSIVDQCKGKVFQFALGGRGDPDQHESFEEILKYSRENGIIPNMTTSGYQLNRHNAELISKYCGAAAVSWYKNEYTYKAIDMLLEAGSKVNLHFVLSARSLEEAISIIEEEKIPKGINRIIFLLFKPVGQGKNEEPLIFDERTRYFFSLIDTKYGMAKIGFDSCSVPGVLNSTNIVDPNCYDACEAARYSAFITSEMMMVPCSFDQDHRWSVSLKENTLQQAWRSKEFEEFRKIQMEACPECSRRNLCLGGCPISPEITLCNEKQKRGVR